LTSKENRWRRLIVRWTGPKGFAAIVLFFVLAVILEVLLVYSFQMFGLTDPNVWTTNLLIPLANWTFSLSVSPLFHLLPISVIVVLLSSWTYLTRYTAFIPQRIEPARRVSTPTRRGPERRRFKSLRQLVKRLDRRLQRVGRVLKTGVQRIRGVSYISQRLFFARAAVRSAVIVLVVFLSVLFVLFLVEYPDIIHNWTLHLYKGSPALLNFVSGANQWFSGVGMAVQPLGEFGFAVNKALLDSAPGFRYSLEAAGASLTGPIVQLDAVGKYVLSQNLAAWTSATASLAYGVYASSRTHRRPKGR